MEIEHRGCIAQLLADAEAGVEAARAALAAASGEKTTQQCSQFPELVSLALERKTKARQTPGRNK